MGALTEPELDGIVARGCACGSRELRFRAIVPGVVRVFLGDALGPPRWTYEGEDFVAAVFQVSCARCGAACFERTECPACGAAAGAARALGREPALRVPDRCDACDFEELAVKILVPVEQSHDGKHAGKVVAASSFGDLGCQPLQADCVSCKAVVVRATGPCPACGGA